MLRDATVFAATDLMVSIAYRSYEQQPGPISPHIYYTADGEWQQVTEQTPDGAISITASGRLLEALQRLGLIDPDDYR